MSINLNFIVKRKTKEKLKWVTCRNKLVHFNFMDIVKLNGKKIVKYDTTQL